ncbi:unnamed protein product [Cochlearia groenlandica]
MVTSKRESKRGRKRQYGARDDDATYVNITVEEVLESLYITLTERPIGARTRNQSVNDRKKIRNALEKLTMAVYDAMKKAGEERRRFGDGHDRGEGGGAGGAGILA